MGAALLIMDMQAGIVERVPEGKDALVASVARARSAARSAGLPVLYVRVAFREGMPEVSPRNKSFSALASGGGFGEDAPSTQIHPDLTPGPGEVVVVKRRVSAFSGSDLDVVLRAQGIDTLVLTGIATSGVVLSTVRQAADLDFGLVVLADAVADMDAEVHRVLMEKVFPRQAEVMTVAEWVSSLG